MVGKRQTWGDTLWALAPQGAGSARSGVAAGGQVDLNRNSWWGQRCRQRPVPREPSKHRLCSVGPTLTQLLGPSLLRASSWPPVLLRSPQPHTWPVPLRAPDLQEPLLLLSLLWLDLTALVPPLGSHWAWACPPAVSSPWADPEPPGSAPHTGL